MIKSDSISERILSRVRVAGDGCWYWLGHCNGDGYGKCNKGRYGEWLAHRASYRQFKGEIPPGMYVIHSCDVPCCVNPDHLSVGTQTDNMHDMIAKGRYGSPSIAGTANPRARLNEDSVREIRQRFAAGESYRDLVRDYGVAASSIYRVVRGGAWAHVN